MRRKKKKKDRRDVFLSLISVDAKKVLDVGCGEGNLGFKLREKGIEVVGIEKDEKSYLLAKEKLNRVFLTDVEKFQLPFSKGYFDCIIYADVLEHFIYPLAVLRKHRDFLNNSGYIIASIPNIRYYKIIIRLFLGGSWDYMDKGILDKSHLRFFTLINIKELFADAGYEIVEIKRNFVASRGFKVLNFFLFNGLKDFLTYQYYIKARKHGAKYISSTRKRKIDQF
ncbi:MAG: class I SAM-dependent methyltransferase [Candidatus Omnitrophica bacterium]|nr:class I SAM-dependent methyltransferase [Candidatus Omnitrophota bacterium]MBU1810778.1 class I SAM-dependent methyltransferase [Candidatus Omnitrophota bacterium]